MKLMTSILTAAVMTGGAWAQNPNIINNVQNKMNAVEQQKTDDSNAALESMGSSAAKQETKPTAGAPAPAVKPARIPVAKATASTTSGSSNKLERVNVVRHGDDVQIELSAQDSVSPRVSKMTSPERLVVEFPATAMATAQNKIAVGNAGVKGVRIGMNDKTPPTTSVVVDLEQAHAYDMTPGPANKFVLTLHAQGVAKSTPPPAKSATASAKVQTVTATPVATPAAPAPKTTAKITAQPGAAPKATAKITPVSAPVNPKEAVAAAPKTVAAAARNSSRIAASNAKTADSPFAASNKITASVPEKPEPATKTADAAKAPKPEEKKWAMNGKRDPFFSPVVQQNSGSGCSTGKKCLEIGQINLRGVVKAEAGFIAVVTNSADKAYFLHENDPVFNGYVVRITGDSVVFQETVQDKLGKPFTREVTKKITTPAV
jgi:Tfp pilus assembly protein PilP